LSKFDFVSGDRFRDSLEQDYEELTKCLDAGAWKAVHVLAGSIVEALMIDFLISIGHDEQKTLKLDFAQATDACLQENVISRQSADLTNVIREFRNLIHPGRVARLRAVVDEDGARIARSLTDRIIKEFSANTGGRVGYTAAQIANKLEADPRATPVLRHLVRQCSSDELARLLTTTLPAKYFALRHAAARSEFEFERDYSKPKPGWDLHGWLAEGWREQRR
jgi:hypothetical protein